MSKISTSQHYPAEGFLRERQILGRFLIRQ